MIFLSEGETVEPAKIGYRSLGFGEKIDLPTKKFKLILEKIDFPQCFFEHADSFIYQCKIDDEQQGHPDIQEIGDLKYPKFIELLENHIELATEVIQDYLYFDLLESLFPNSKNLKSVINNISKITTNNSQIIVYGETFEFTTT